MLGLNPALPRRGSARREPDHGDLAVRLGLVLGEVVLLAGDALPRRGALVAGQRPWRHRRLAAVELDLDLVGMRGDVVAPRGVLGRSAPRADDQPGVVAVGKRHDGRRPALPALGTHRREVQQRVAAHLVPGQPMDPAGDAHDDAPHRAGRRAARAACSTRRDLDSHGQTIARRPASRSTVEGHGRRHHPPRRPRPCRRGAGSATGGARRSGPPRAARAVGRPDPARRPDHRRRDRARRALQHRAAAAVPGAQLVAPALLELVRPSPASIVNMGARAGVGQTTFLLALFLGVPSLMMFDWLFWWAGKRWGDRVFIWLLGSEGERSTRRLARLHRLERRFGPWAVVFAYILPVPSTLIYAAVGDGGMGLRAFLVLDLLGTLLWAGLLATLGY